MVPVIKMARFHASTLEQDAKLFMDLARAQAGDTILAVEPALSLHHAERLCNAAQAIFSAHTTPYRQAVTSSLAPSPPPSVAHGRSVSPAPSISGSTAVSLSALHVSPDGWALLRAPPKVSEHGITREMWNDFVHRVTKEEHQPDGQVFLRVDHKALLRILANQLYTREFLKKPNEEAPYDKGDKKAVFEALVVTWQQLGWRDKLKALLSNHRANERKERKGGNAAAPAGGDANCDHEKADDDGEANGVEEDE